MKEFRTPLPIKQQRRGTDRFGHLAREDGPWTLRRRIGLVGSHVVQVHFLVCIGTTLVRAGSANSIYEKRYTGFGVASLYCFPCRLFVPKT
jgi:hypothetical protein